MQQLRRLASSKSRQQTLVDVFENHAQRNPNKTFLVYQDQRYSYGDIEKEANKVANAAREQNVQQEDIVALLINNEPAFIWTFLGLAKIGVTCALLNFNLRSKGLLHCFKISKAKTLIVGQGQQLTESVREILPDLRKEEIAVWVQGTNGNDLPGGVVSMDELTALASDQRSLPEYRNKITFQHSAVYIYTSGTTGLPKATKLSHYKLLAGGLLLSYFNVASSDVIYITMPLYHISALFIGMANALTAGATIVLRNKFSATHFWDDCRKYDVTVILYIGELFRYLLAKPKEANDCDNKVRLAVGNGLGSDIWEEVKERYNIPQIVETYGATEGNFGMMNVDNRVGSVGCWSPLLRSLCPIELVKYDYESAHPVRDESGRCIKVKTGETGLLVCPVTKTFPLEGYVDNKELTQKKILNNVFREGDLYYNTGDLLLQDEANYFYFKDRLGDTFRWKGENVATTEVAQTMSEFNGIQESSVYGVNIPGHDGKGGMAAITILDGFTMDCTGLYHHVTSRLPNYACPRFLRLKSAIPHTSTFKQRKVDLIHEGFDPSLINDPLFWMDSNSKSYIPLDHSTYLNIINGTARL
ncbi:long-chain fatty acid transport protein 2-like [Glandiceps talaboti]